MQSSKSHFPKDIVFCADTLFFCTSKHELIFIKGDECIDEKETEMMRVRWRISSFFSQIPEKEQSPERSSVSKTMFCEIHSK